MKRLVVTADDFGLSREVNEAVEIAHRDGILTAASLMVGTPGFEDAVARARTLPGLRVGLHLALVDAPSVLPPPALPDLVDPATGQFRLDMAASGMAMAFRPAARRQLRAEVDAQFAAFARTGLPLDHVNAHRHFHLHPAIASAMIEVGRRYGMRAVRVPREPALLVRRIDPSAQRAIPALTAPFSALLAARMRWAGLRVPDRVFGLAWSGAMTADRLEAVLDLLPDGVTEIYTHPATAGGFAGAAPGYLYAEELAALTAPRVRAALARSAVRTGGFGDLF